MQYSWRFFSNSLFRPQDWDDGLFFGFVPLPPLLCQILMVRHLFLVIMALD